MRTSTNPDDHDWRITVDTTNLTPEQRQALFEAVVAAAGTITDQADITGEPAPPTRNRGKSIRVHQRDLLLDEPPDLTIIHGRHADHHIAGPLWHRDDREGHDLPADQPERWWYHDRSRWVSWQTILRIAVEQDLVLEHPVARREWAAAYQYIAAQLATHPEPAAQDVGRLLGLHAAEIQKGRLTPWATGDAP